MCGRVQIPRSVVPVEGKQAANDEAPLDCLVGDLEPEEGFQLQRVVALLLRGVVLEVVLLRFLKFFDVFSAELVDLRHFLGVRLGSLVEVVRGILLLPTG